jgi:uncharacterized membrane protein (DUF2068 family)
MRPIGVTLIAILNWLRASLFALGGLALIGVGHLSARLVSAVATDSIFEKLISFLGKSLGIGALLIAMVFVVAGLGLWLLRNWGRTLTLGLVGVWLFFGLLGLLRHPGPFHVLRVAVDAAIVVYLLLPGVRRLFTVTGEVGP